MLDNKLTKIDVMSKEENTVTTLTTASGKIIPLEEFLTWSPKKQANNLMPKNLGKRFSQAHKDNIRKGMIRALANGTINSNTLKPVSTPIGEFKTISQGAKTYGVGRDTFKSWIKKGKDGFSYLNEKYISKHNVEKLISSNGSPVSTPLGEFKTIHEGAKAYNITTQTLSQWLKNNKEGFHYIKAKKISNNVGPRNSSWLEKKVRTPHGIFKSTVAAAEFENTTAVKIRKLAKDPSNKDYYYISKESNY